MKFLIQFVHKHHDFQLSELHSLAKLERVPFTIQSNHSLESPFLIIETATQELAKRLVKRSILIKNIIELWSEATDINELLSLLKSLDTTKYKQMSFKYLVSSFGKCLSLEDQKERINKLEQVLNLQGVIKLLDPELTLAYFEERGHNTNETGVKRVYFGRLIAEGVGSKIVSQFDLKKRSYVGTTSMDAELSLLSANQALVKPGFLVYDPFVGTGSFLVAAAYFGGYVFGSDIDGRKQPRILENMSQYKLNSTFLGTMVADTAHNPWKKQSIFDAIICDPPYGIREGARKITSTDASPFKKNGELRYPKTEPYDLSDIIVDLINFAFIHLRDKGRLVFWLPSPNDTYKPQDIPNHPAMKIISVSVQPFGKWSRRLITMEKMERVNVENIGVENLDISGLNNTKPAHSGFRDFYFKPKTSKS